MIYNLRSLVITGFVAALSAVAITAAALTVKNSAHETMADEIAEIKKVMQCGNNSCDRFKGKDAKALEARLLKVIEIQCSDERKKK